MWVDKLGWPWPKHPCFDATPNAATLATLHESSSHVHGASGAVVTHVEFVRGARECFVVIANPGGGTGYWIVRDMQDPATLVGALVALSPADRRLVLPGIGTFEIVKPMFPCLLCNTGVPETDLDQHMAERHNVLRCPTCGGLVQRDEFEAHLQRHKSQTQAAREVPCLFCKTGVPETDLDEHMAESHDVLRCPTCGGLVQRDEFEAHLQRHKSQTQARR